MSFTRSDADAVLKEFYLPPLREQLNQATPLLAELAKNEENVEGRRSVFPVHTGRSEAVGARADGGTLPTAANQVYKEARVDHTYQYGVIKVTGPTIRSTKSDKGSFIRAVDAETKGMLAEMKEDFDRQIAANRFDGDTEQIGALAQVADAEASGQTVLTLDPFNAAQARRLRVGMRVEIFKDIDGTATEISGASTSITAIDASAPSVTVDVAITADADDQTWIFREGSAGNEMNGLRGIVDDAGTLHNVNPSTVTEWKATVVANSGTERALSEDLMQQVVDNVAIAGGEEIDAIVCDFVQRRKYNALLQSQKRIVNSLDLKGGYKAISFNDSIPLIVDRFVDSNLMYFVNRKHLALYQLADWSWADDDGAILSRVSGEDAYTAYLYKFANFGTDKRNAHGVLEDLAD